MLAFLLLAPEAYCQTDSLGCDVLTKIVSSNYFQERFKISNHPNENLNLIDTCNYFNNCILPSIFGRQVTVSTTLPEKIKLHNSPAETVNNIVIYKVEKSKNLIVVNLWQPYSNAMLILSVKINRQSCKSIKVVQSGFF